MKKITLTCAFILGLATGLSAQSASSAVTPPQMAEIKAKDMKRDYYLNEAQYKQSVAIETEFYSQTMHSDGTRPTADQMKVINEQRDEAYKKLLPIDQYAKYKSVKRRTAPAAGGNAPAEAPSGSSPARK